MIRFEMQQDHGAGHHQKGFQKPSECPAHFIRMPLQIGRHIDNNEYLSQFGRLKIEEAQINPSSTAIDNSANARNQDQRQQSERKQQQIGTDTAPESHGQMKGCQHRNTTQHRKHTLPLEMKEWITVAAAGYFH